MKSWISFDAELGQSHRVRANPVTLLAALLGCGFLLSCAPPPTEARDDPKPQAPQTGPALIGRIASIPGDRRFVLIQSYGKWKIEAGRILTTRGPEQRTANLLTTGESLGEFAAADLQSGQVEVGDAVYSQHHAKVVEPQPASDPAEKPTDPPNSKEF